MIGYTILFLSFYFILYQILTTMIEMYRSADKNAQITLIGASLCKFAGALALIWGSVNVYFFSFLKQHG